MGYFSERHIVADTGVGLLYLDSPIQTATPMIACVTGVSMDEIDSMIRCHVTATDIVVKDTKWENRDSVCARRFIISHAQEILKAYDLVGVDISVYVGAVPGEENTKWERGELICVAHLTADDKVLITIHDEALSIECARYARVLDNNRRAGLNTEFTSQLQFTYAKDYTGFKMD